MLDRCALLLSIFLILQLGSFSQAPVQHEDDSRASSSASDLLVECDASSWTITADGAYAASNRAHALDCRVDADGLVVVPQAQSATGAPWKLELRTHCFGGLHALGEPRLVPRGDRIEIERTALREWFVNDARGIEQGWTIAAAPSGCDDSDLQIEVEVSGLRAVVPPDGACALFVDATSKPRLRYSGLRAWDADGCPLSARLLGTETGFAVVVEVGRARYPITIDPVLGGLAWWAEGDQFGAHFGESVAGAGDVNGDGFDDLLVGAGFYEHGEAHEGRLFVYLGSPDGPSLVADWTAELDQENAWLGVSVSGAGDVNGDGFDDVIAGARGFTHAQSFEGGAFLFLGSPSGLSLAPDWSAEGDQDHCHFGLRVSRAGDVNGDGFDDVLVAAPSYDAGQTDEGRVWLYLGSASGLSIAPAWTAENDVAYSNFGGGLSGAGDVNGDGFDDVLVGAPRYENGQSDEGSAYLYFGSPSGPSLVADWTTESDYTGVVYGSSVAGAGDVNGDGYADILVGAPKHADPSATCGPANLYLGSASGPSLTPDWIGDEPPTDYGGSLAGAGDVDGDGFDDVIVGASGVDGTFVHPGAAFVYSGSAGGLSLVSTWKAVGSQDDAAFGCSVACAGDVDGAGLDDVIVGASLFHDPNANEGAAFLYPGYAPIGTKYCTANPNSSGAPADLTAWTSRRSAADHLELLAGPVPNQFGIFFHGANQAQVPFGNGFLCTSGDIVRGVVLQAQGHVASYTYDGHDAKHSLTAHVGTTRNFQYWFRDPIAFPAYFNTSNAVSIAILP